ncbi:MAG: peptidylprolyl isomerase [Burkholderiales bacterium]|nr:peptidylprolyl isomerase [Burkholderiales bacterium]
MKSLLRRISLFVALALAACFAQAQPSMVRIQTTQGALDLTLVADAPVSTANFLAYLRDGSYNDVFVHRNAWLSSTTPFVIQMGGYRWAASGAISLVPTKPPITNEFSAQRSNVRGTVAMAKIGGNPNSATSQFFVNMGNNAANLDAQNGGFTVFARVTQPGMVVADRIANLVQVGVNISIGGQIHSLTDLPVSGWQPGVNPARHNVVLFTDAYELATATETDRLFNYLEAQFAQYLQPQKGIRGTWEGYTYSYYPGTNTFAGVKDGKVWYYMPSVSGTIGELGTVEHWWGLAQAAGY